MHAKGKGSSGNIGLISIQKASWTWAATVCAVLSVAVCFLAKIGESSPPVQFSDYRQPFCSRVDDYYLASSPGSFSHARTNNAQKLNGGVSLNCRSCHVWFSVILLQTDVIFCAYINCICPFWIATLFETVTGEVHRGRITMKVGRGGLQVRRDQGALATELDPL